MSYIYFNQLNLPTDAADVMTHKFRLSLHLITILPLTSLFGFLIFIVSFVLYKDIYVFGTVQVLSLSFICVCLIKFYWVQYLTFLHKLIFRMSQLLYFQSLTDNKPCLRYLDVEVTAGLLVFGCCGFQHIVTLFGFRQP